MSFGSEQSWLAGFCEYGMKFRVPYKVENFLNQLSDYRLFKDGFMELETINV
jgi:hypothetical protein